MAQTLVCVHNQQRRRLFQHPASKLRKKTEDQIFGAVRVAASVREAEARVAHQRTIVIGDLNMNPFEVGVVGSGGLHAIVDRGIASGGSRPDHRAHSDHLPLICRLSPIEELVNG